MRHNSYTLNEAAEILGIPRNMLVREILQGRIASIHIMDRRMILAEELDRYIREAGKNNGE